MHYSSLLQDDLHFLMSAETLETFGVTADLGLTLFFRDPLFTAVLGGLTAGAAQFAAVDRTLIWPHVNETLPEFNMTVRDFMDAVSSYRDALDGPVSIDQSYVFAGGMNLVTSDYNGVLPARLPQQWISIAQCGQDAGGCFFPEGMAGPINTTQPLAIPTIPAWLIAANNAPVAVEFTPWPVGGADPFANKTPPYYEGYTKLRPPGEPYVAKQPAEYPAPYQFPPPSKRTEPKVRSPVGAVSELPGIPATNQMVPAGALANASRAPAANATRPGAQQAGVASTRPLPSPRVVPSSPPPRPVATEPAAPAPAPAPARAANATA